VVVTATAAGLNAEITMHDMNHEQLDRLPQYPMKAVALNVKRTLKRQNLASTLAEDLRKRIIRGELAGGTTLRQEQLAQEYGVSRMPVREALQQLDSEGLISNQAHFGASVVELSHDEINELFDLRLMLEPDLLARAIPNMTAASLSKSQNLLHELDQAYQIGDLSHWGILNTQFHLSLYEPSCRPITLAFLQKTSLQIDRYMRIHMAMTEAISDGAEDHQRILELSRMGRIQAATELLIQHIRQTREQLVYILSARKSGQTMVKNI